MKRMFGLLITMGLCTIVGACNLPGADSPIEPAGEIQETVAQTPLDTDQSGTGDPSSGGTDQVPEGPPTAPPALAGELETGVQRIPVGSSLVIQYIEMIDNDFGWAIGGTDGRSDSVLRTEDGGISWREVSPPELLDDGVAKMAVGSFLDVRTAWVLYHPIADPQPGVLQELRIWRTSDGGNHWQASAPVMAEFVGAGFAPARIRFTDKEHGWVMARYGGSGMHRYPVYLLRSEDSGLHWQILEDPYEGRYLQSCPKTGWAWHVSGAGAITIGFCPFESAEVHLSDDSGQTWQSTRLPFPESDAERLGSASCEAHSPLFIGEGELLVASSCPLWDDEPETLHFLYRSLDMGESWSIMPYPGGTLQHVGGDVLMALGREIYRSSDLGITWEAIKQVNWDGQFSFVDAQQGWVIARDEAEIALVHTQDGGVSWQIVDPKLIP